MVTVQEKSLVNAWGELLVKYGFIAAEEREGKNIRELYTFEEKSGTIIFKKKDNSKINPDHALMEYAEDIDINAPYQRGATEYVPTGYPSPGKRYHILYEAFNLSIEEVYFWLIDHIRYDQSWTRAYKIRDIFTATENSAFFGASQQRLGIQQDRVQQYLATIGKMTKDLFQIVRELRILDEKLQPRREWKKSKSADATLKSEFIDLVENRGGQTSPGSVYGLASQLGYATLPDLFFNTQVYELEKVDQAIDRLDFNTNVKNVLKRKLYQFVNWKLKTDHELESRRTFTLKYLRQHWDVIEMYMNWVKPYLRHIARLQMNDTRLTEPDLIGAFEQSYVETEVLFAKPQPKEGKMRDCLLLTINFRTRPNLSYQQEGYNRGPVHVGQADIFLRTYTWTDQHITNYRKYREQEDLYMIGVVDKSVQAAMEAMGEELEKYLAEAGEPKYKERIQAEEKETAKRKKEEQTLFGSLLEPFSALGSGFGDLFGMAGASVLFSTQKAKKPSFTFAEGWAGGKKNSGLNKQTYQVIKNFKKSHGMLTWG